MINTRSFAHLSQIKDPFVYIGRLHGGVAVDGVAADGMAADEAMIQGFVWKQRRASSLQVNPAHRRQFF